MQANKLRQKAKTSCSQAFFLRVTRSQRFVPQLLKPAQQGQGLHSLLAGSLCGTGKILRTCPQLVLQWGSQ